MFYDFKKIFEKIILKFFGKNAWIVKKKCEICGYVYGVKALLIF